MSFRRCCCWAVAVATVIFFAGCGGSSERPPPPWACDGTAAKPPLDPYQQATALGRSVNFGNELLNEPSGYDADTWNDIAAETIAAIRAIDSRHTIVVDVTSWGDMGGLEGMQLPDSETNAIVSFHYYRPNLFCFQGKQAWAGADMATTGIIWPHSAAPEGYVVKPAEGVGEWVVKWIGDYNTLPADQNPTEEWAIANDLAQAAAWRTDNGRPLWMGEFTAQDGGDLDSRARWIQAVRTHLEENDIPWSFWTLISDPGTRLYDPSTERWTTELTDALGLSVSN
jgi:endoglucanase